MIKDFHKEVLDKVQVGKVIRICCEDGIDIRIKILDSSYICSATMEERGHLILIPCLLVETDVKVYQKGKVIFKDVIECKLDENEIEILLDDNCLLTQSSEHQCEELMKYTIDDIIIDDIYLKLLDRLKVEKGVIINDCVCK